MTSVICRQLLAKAGLISVDTVYVHDEEQQAVECFEPESDDKDENKKRRGWNRTDANESPDSW